MPDQHRGMSGAMGADAYRDFEQYADESLQLANEYVDNGLAAEALATLDDGGRYALPYNPTLERAYLIVDQALPGQKHQPKHAKAPMTLRQVTDLTMERIRRLGRSR